MSDKHVHVPLKVQ